MDKEEDNKVKCIIFKKDLFFALLLHSFHFIPVALSVQFNKCAFSYLAARAWATLTP